MCRFFHYFQFVDAAGHAMKRDISRWYLTGFAVIIISLLAGIFPARTHNFPRSSSLLELSRGNKA